MTKNTLKQLPILAKALAWLAPVGLMLGSCDDFLDLKPQDQISPEDYYTNVAQLESYTINLYGTIYRSNIGFNPGIATFDNGTDNQAGNGQGPIGDFTQDNWRVPSSGGIGFGNIRSLNKFITESEEKIAEGRVAGSEEEINQAMGEAYYIRAVNYYDKLRAYGDFPIVLRELNVDDDLTQEEKRMPRNEVARQILKDLDTAIGLLQERPSGGNRIGRLAALTVKSNVALYEATFEMYHRGSGRVPGDDNWPGKDMEWNKGKTFDIDGEINFFLTQAMDAAKKVADAVPLVESNHQMNPTKIGEYSGWNPYYDLFASADLSDQTEAILWKQFSIAESVTHRTSNRLLKGSGTGWTRGLVESFLMANGLPIYAPGSGYHGDVTIDDAKADRDERLRLFVFGESDILSADSLTKFVAPGILNIPEVQDVTGYRQRKALNYDPAYQQEHGGGSDISGQIIIRAVEAYLNYIEASYLKNGSLDGTATAFWTALRTRAGITAPISTTIAATDMSYEADATRPSYDWAAFSAGKPVDATLYSIRRERRSELAGEGYRWDDLVRWRAMDQVKDYDVEGVNFWDKIYKYHLVSTGGDDSKYELIDDGGATANVSSRTESKYLQPYRIRKNGTFYESGFTFYQAHYLSPFSFREMQLASPTGDVKDTYLYQNPYWPTYAGGIAEK